MWSNLKKDHRNYTVFDVSHYYFPQPDKIALMACPQSSSREPVGDRCPASTAFALKHEHLHAIQ